jgi:hypothetical protein
MKRARVRKVVYKKDHLEVHYTDGSIRKTESFTDSNGEKFDYRRK